MKNKFRKANDNGTLVIVGAAIGVLIVIGLFLSAKGMMSSTSDKQSEINNALEQSIQSLKSS